MSELVAILPDQQIPFHDRKLHKLVLKWLAVNQPDRIVYSGDLIDLPSVSRHGWNPQLDPNPHKSITTALAETATYIDQCADAGSPKLQYLVEGNHEARLRNYILKNADRLAFLDCLELPNILKLGERHVEYIGQWPAAKLWLTPKLAVIHGRLARKGSGVTALATLKAVGHSVIMGHTHRLSMVFQTQHPHKGIETRVAVEAGTLARIEGGLGYAPDPDWQAGFVAVRLHPDGGFHCSLATYVKGRLRWEDQEYG